MFKTSPMDLLLIISETAMIHIQHGYNTRASVLCNGLRKTAENLGY